MIGGTQTAAQRAEPDEWAVTESASDEVYDVADAGDTPPRDRLPVVAATLATLLGIGWIAVAVYAALPLFSGGVTLTGAVSLIATIAAPLALIALCYLLAIRTSRTEAARLARVSSDLRGEQARLDTVLASVAARLDGQRQEVAEQADRLMTLGEDAAGRLRAVGDKLKADIEALAHDAETIERATQAARGEVTALLGDLPKVQVQTHRTTVSIEAAGLAAHERAGALDAQVAALVARGREADEVAGGAAQKLAAHLSRVEGVAQTASAQFTAAAESMTGALDAALARAAEAGDAARQGMEAQGAAIMALVEQGDAAIAKTGAEAGEALAQRVEEITVRLNSLGEALTAHETHGNKLIYGLSSGIDRLDERFAAIDEGAEARETRLSGALSALASQASTLADALDRGRAAAEGATARTESLMTALDATVRELDETFPVAFARVDASADASRAKIAELAPEVARIEHEASAALDRLLAAEKLLAEHMAALDALGDTAGRRLDDATAKTGDLVAAVAGAESRSSALAESASATLVDAMVRVRETAQIAADRAREALAAVVPDSADRLSTAVREALSASVTGEVEAQIVKLAANAEAAVGAANAASDRLMRQMLTIAETSAQVESRIVEAHAEIDAADSDNFARRVALLIESLNSTAIDVTKILSNDVTDTAWNAYLKGDRGVFARRAVRLLDSGEAREILRHYNEEPEFRDQVNRYVHDFEAMLRNVLATRSGSPLGVTLLSSDTGKLYVALAQAIERLRT
jgi:hypothetical protein